MTMTISFIDTIIERPFYRWSVLFFVYTYFANHVNLARNTGSFTYHHKIPSPQLRRPQMLSDETWTTSGLTRLDPKTVKQPAISSLGLKSGSKPTIAVATCATTRNWEHLEFGSLALIKLMLPSLVKTMETDRFKYKLYVGVDDTDTFWNDRLNQERLQRLAGTNLQIQVLAFAQPSSGHRIPLNEICKAAYDDGAMYIARINDDTEFVTPFWTSLGIRKLNSFEPKNVGVVGPTCHENVRILTHDFVHRTHLDIFGADQYYPKAFKNWYVDDWITLVYGKDRTRMLTKWEVKHHIHYHGTRYTAQEPPTFREEVDRGKRILQKWLEVSSKKTQDSNLMGE